MSLVDFIFPKLCLTCHRAGTYACFDCAEQIASPKPICPLCVRPSIDGITHIRCRRPQGIDGLTCLFVYQGLVRKSILAMKYRFAREIAKDLSLVAVARLKKMVSFFPQGSILIPVPLHRRRKSWRGFNQVEEIGKSISLRMKWKDSPDILFRGKFTHPQTELKGKERRKNVRGAFSINPDRKWLIINRSFVLFDDVYTTGSTIKEAAKVLKRGGAKRVWGLTIAR